MTSRFPLCAGLVLAVAAAASALGTPAAAVTGPWVVHDEARVRLIGGARELGLEFELQPGWHVYWKNSGDAGYPPRLDLTATRAIRGATLLFPAPRRFELPGGLVSFGYTDRVLFPIAAELAPAGEGKIAVRARLDYLVCREECIPHTTALALDLPPQARADDPEAARLAAARADLPLSGAATAGAPRVTLRVDSSPEDALTLELVAGGGAWRAAAPDLFFEAHPLFALDRPEISATAAGLRFRVRLRPLDETRPLPRNTTFAWTLTGLEPSSTSGTVPASVAFAGTTIVDLPH